MRSKPSTTTWTMTSRLRSFSAAADIQWLRLHEEAVFEGYAHIEGRESGRPLALAARLRQGKKSRNAVKSAAELLYSGDVSLRHNDAKTAQRIAQMKLTQARWHLSWR